MVSSTHPYVCVFVASQLPQWHDRDACPVLPSSGRDRYFNLNHQQAGFERVFVPPCPGDEGVAVGCAAFGWHQRRLLLPPSDDTPTLEGGQEKDVAAAAVGTAEVSAEDESKTTDTAAVEGGQRVAGALRAPFWGRGWSKDDVDDEIAEWESWVDVRGVAGVEVCLYVRVCACVSGGGRDSLELVAKPSAKLYSTHPQNGHFPPFFSGLLWYSSTNVFPHASCLHTRTLARFVMMYALTPGGSSSHRRRKRRRLVPGAGRVRPPRSWLPLAPGGPERSGDAGENQCRRQEKVRDGVGLEASN